MLTCDLNHIFIISVSHLMGVPLIAIVATVKIYMFKCIDGSPIIRVTLPERPNVNLDIRSLSNKVSKI